MGFIKFPSYSLIQELFGFSYVEVLLSPTLYSRNSKAFIYLYNRWNDIEPPSSLLP